MNIGRRRITSASIGPVEPIKPYTVGKVMCQTSACGSDPVPGTLYCLQHTRNCAQCTKFALPYSTHCSEHST